MAAEGAGSVDGLHYANGQPISVRLAGGSIAAVEAADPAAAVDRWQVAPGMVDLQVNGYGGHDFNAEPADPQAASKVVRRLRALGVTSLLPTVISGSDEGIRGALASLDRACQDDTEVAGAVPGVHLEGPFISPHDGPRGAHQRRHVRAPDWERLRRWQDAAGGRIRLLTLSPEWPGAPAFVARCVQAGLTVAIGHTAATPAQIREAVAAGARLSTHLGNGCHLQLPRHDNYLWEQLAHDGLHASLIADGFHLPAAVLKVALRAKGQRALLVSDAVAVAGQPPGAYRTTVGERVILTSEGRLHLAGRPQLLAGSAQPLPRGVEHLVATGLADPPSAWDMASVRPARLLGLEAGAGLTADAPADLVRFRWDDGRLRIDAVYKAGRRFVGAGEEGRT